MLGEKEVAKYLVDEVQQVYRLQGVKINDKHIEVIVRQMLKRVRITDPGDSEFLLGEHVEKPVFEEVNAQLVAQEQRPAVAEPLLPGITKASLSTQSFISAASFQETTKVLTDAATAGKVDNLLGLKEDIRMGRPIPAGSGLRQYRDIRKWRGRGLDFWKVQLGIFTLCGAGRHLRPCMGSAISWICISALRHPFWA